MCSYFSKTILGLSVFCAAQALSAPLQTTQTDTFDFGWKFARFGDMPDGTRLAEPGGSALDGIIKADSSETEKGNTADKAIDGDMSTRWCAADNKPGHHITWDMGRTVKAAKIIIDWEKQDNHLYKLEGSNDGKRWTTLADKTKGENKSATDETAVTGSLRHFKITVEGNGGANWASIREITVLDGQDRQITPQIKTQQASQLPQSVQFNDSGWRSLDLPHDWGIEGPFRMDLPNETGKLPWAGIGWYRKAFDVPADAKGNQFYLDFDGVMSRPKIYVNGELAGEWKYGYSSFRVDITPFLQYGKKNTVAVRVDNPPDSSRWYPGGGIYRHVWLTESSPVHIDNWGVYVRTPEISKEWATLDIDTTVVNKSDAEITPSIVEQIINNGQVVAGTESKGQPIASGKTGTVASRLTVKNPVLWDIENPHLYVVRTTVKVGDKVLDSKDTTVGIRTVQWKPEGFFLNGRKVKLYGVCQHHDLGPLGGAVHYKGYQRQVKILKEMGVNSIRTSHNPPSPELLDICDREGILVIDELFDMWKAAKKGQDYHNYFPEWHERDLVNLCHRDRNHPCVIAWSTGNEISEQGPPEGHKISQMLTDLFHREDPTRKVTAGCNNQNAAHNGFADTVDVYGYNYKPHAYVEFTQRRPNQPFYASETSSCVSTRGVYFFPDEQDFWSKNKGFYNFQVSSYDLYAPGWAYRPDIEFKAQDDCPQVAGEYVWTGFDYLGEPTPYNQDTTNALNFATPEEREKAMEELKRLGNRGPSRSSYFGIVDLCGFKKDRFYIYQAQWKKEQPMAHILPHWNWPDRKGKITPVHVYTTGDEAELFLNGKSLGKKTKGMGDKDRYRLVWEDVEYQPGKLEVAVTKNGKSWAKTSVQTTESPVSLKITPEHKTIKGDGRDLSYVTITVHDKNGAMVPTANNEIAIKANGAAEIVAVCNGDPTDFTTMRITEPDSIVKIKAFNGMAQVILRSKRGQQGKATVQVAASGLSQHQATISVTEATPEELRTAR